MYCGGHEGAQYHLWKLIPGAYETNQAQSFPPHYPGVITKLLRHGLAKAWCEH